MINDDKQRAELLDTWVVVGYTRRLDEGTGYLFICYFYYFYFFSRETETEQKQGERE